MGPRWEKEMSLRSGRLLCPEPFPVPRARELGQAGTYPIIFGNSEEGGRKRQPKGYLTGALSEDQFPR